MISTKLLVVILVAVVGVIGLTVAITINVTDDKAAAEAAAKPEPPRQELSDSDRKFREGKVQNSPGKGF
jgi:hypothetical protein